MKKLFLFCILLTSLVFFRSCKGTSAGPAVEGNWDCGDDCLWRCSITKQEGGIVMQTNEGIEYVFEKKSGEFYSAQMGMITLVYHKDPIGPNACPGTHKGHWRLNIPGEKVIILHAKEEKC